MDIDRIIEMLGRELQHVNGMIAAIEHIEAIRKAGNAPAENPRKKQQRKPVDYPIRAKHAPTAD